MQTRASDTNNTTLESLITRRIRRVLINILVEQSPPQYNFIIHLHCTLLVPADAAFSFTKQPLNPTIVVMGYNSSRLTLAWNYSASSGEMIVLMRIQRLSNSNSKGVTLTSGFGSPSQGKVVGPFNKDGHFGFTDPASLVINQVTTNDEFVYRCEVLTASNPDGHKNDINLKVYSKFYDILIYGNLFSISIQLHSV